MHSQTDSKHEVTLAGDCQPKHIQDGKPAPKGEQAAHAHTLKEQAPSLSLGGVWSTALGVAVVLGLSIAELDSVLILSTGQYTHIVYWPVTYTVYWPLSEFCWLTKILTLSRGLCNHVVYWPEKLKSLFLLASVITLSAGQYSNQFTHIVYWKVY